MATLPGSTALLVMELLRLSVICLAPNLAATTPWGSSRAEPNARPRQTVGALEQISKVKTLLLLVPEATHEERLRALGLG